MADRVARVGGGDVGPEEDGGDRSGAADSIPPDEARDVVVPLYRGSRAWGTLRFAFADRGEASWLGRARSLPFAPALFIALVSFPLFYFYLGRMLKALDPSSAVPGRVRSALDTIAESLLVIDRHGNVVLANAAFSELTGRAADALVGVSIGSLAWELEGEEAPCPWDHTLGSGEPIRHDMIAYVDASGTRRRFIVNCSPVTGAKGQVGGVLISLDDVTRLEEQERLLRQSMDAAEEASRAKSAFLSNMSHEIRTPMTAILGFTDVLSRGQVASEEERRRHLATISKSGRHLLGLINDLLDLSKVESGAMTVERIATEPAAVVHEVIKVLRVKAEEKEIGLELEIAEALPESFESDPARLRQIITNLVGNAIKFTESGEVRVIVGRDAAAGALLIEIRDTGIGMSAVQLAGIFDAFAQADASITRRFGGTGLGLSISRELARALGGDVTVTSEPGEGSTFTVTLPLGDAASAPLLDPDTLLARLERVEDGTESVWRFDGTRVLVVDDAAENRELLSLVLGEMELEVTLACNGQEALERVASERFDAILMDIQMPIMDGYEAVGRLREAGETLPVIALTANAMKGYEARILEAGFSHYQSKPIDFERLGDLLGDLLGGRREARGAGSASAAEPIEGARDLAPRDERVTDAREGADELIHNTLIGSNPRFVALAERFLVELDERLAAMRAAWEAKEYATLAGLAHRLKGSGAMVGFGALSAPAACLERACGEADAALAARSLDELDALRPRLVVRPARAVRSPARESVEPPSLAHTGDTAEDVRPVTDATAAFGDRPSPADSPITSALPLSDPKFRAIVERFVPRLEAETRALGSALERRDLESVGRLAHWLKGSAGSVGFGVFTEPAERLESAAKTGDEARAVVAFEAIESLVARVRAGWDEGTPQTVSMRERRTGERSG